MSARPRIGMVINPTAGKNTGARIGREAATLLAAAGHEVVDLSAMDGPHALERGRAAIADRAVDCIVVAGGDGMVHLGVNLVAGTDIPLGIIASGTGNDNARELGLPVRDAAKAVERVTHGATRRIDAIRHTTPRGEERWFVGVLAAGFDAVVNERANGWRWPKGQMRYNLAILRELYRERDRLALELDRPPFMLLSHDTLVLLAARRPLDAAKLLEMSGSETKA